MAAFALWEFPTSLTEEQQAQKAALEEKAKHKVHPAGTNVALRTDFFGQINRMRKKYIDTSRDYCKSNSLSLSLPPYLTNLKNSCKLG